MKKIVYIEKDNNNAIALCKDHYKGIAIQVIRFIDQLQPDHASKEMVNVRNHTVIKTICVNITEDGTFKNQVAKAIAEAKEFVSNIRKSDKEIEGIMNDYYSQHKGLNTDEQGK